MAIIEKVIENPHEWEEVSHGMTGMVMVLNISGGYNPILISTDKKTFITLTNDKEVYTKEATFFVKPTASNAKIKISSDFFYKPTVEASGGNGTGTDTPANVFYTNDQPTPVAIGGVAKGSKFDKKTMQYMWDLLLYPYQEPAVTAFSSAKTQFIVGESTGDTLNVSWDTSNQQNITANSGVLILDGKQVATGLPVKGSQAVKITPLVVTAQGNKTARIQFTTNNKKTIYRDIILRWINLMWYGADMSDNLQDVTTIKKMTIKQNVAYKGDYTIANAGYKYFIYPESWGEIKKSIDFASNLEAPLQQISTIDIKNDFNVTQKYRVYRSANLLNGSANFRLT